MSSACDRVESHEAHTPGVLTDCQGSASSLRPSRTVVTFSRSAWDIHQNVRTSAQGTSVDPVVPECVKARSGVGLLSATGGLLHRDVVASALSIPASRSLVCVAAGCALLAAGAAAMSGRFVAAPLAVVAVVAIVAGWIDGRTGRIPNSVVIVGVLAIGLGAVITKFGDHRTITDLAGGAAVGLVLSGAPVLALLWLVQPRWIGAGDVKLLAVAGAAIGLVAPLAAAVMALIACLGALAYAVVCGRRTSIPFGPSVAFGMVVTLAIAAKTNVFFGGIYT